MNEKCTIVTAYYNIKSKFPSEKYLEWAKTFLRLKSPIVLFTESSLVEHFTKLRGSNPLHIVVIPFEELESWKNYKDYWYINYDLNPERDVHKQTSELFAIWAQKSVFVEKAITINPFNTNYFFWCDFGAFRDTNISEIILNTFPTTKYLPEDKILIQSLEKLEEEDKISIDGIYGKEFMPGFVRIVGGLWGGGIQGCLNWKKEYFSMLEKYFQEGRFAGNDQMVMLSTYLNNPNLAIIVKPPQEFYHDIWFFLEHLLSEQNIYKFELDDTYLIQT